MDEVGVGAEEEDEGEDDDGGVTVLELSFCVSVDVISLLFIIDSYLMYIDICI